MVVVVTPTCDRPVALRLACRWMAAQIVQPDHWLIIDGGSTCPVLTHCADVLPPHATVIHPPVIHPAGVRNFLSNWAVGFAHAAMRARREDLVVCWEDDDYYAPTHLAIHARIAADEPTLALIGDDGQRYYHVPTSSHRTFQNRGASLCQTSIRGHALPIARRTIADCQRRSSYGLDALIWSTIPAGSTALTRMDTVVGMKGLPGQAGLGIGHRPRGPWALDPAHATLRSWVGDSAADTYLSLLE